MSRLRVAVGMVSAFMLVSCSSHHAPQSTRALPSGPINYSKTSRDGAPWWNVDVSRIPDAVPSLHTGPYKANPYSVLGQMYYPLQDGRRYRAIGTASWYGTKFHGEATANGEPYDLYGMTAAHKTLPLPTYVKVTNLDNGRSVIVRVNDRGPFYSDRVIDLSFAAARKLGYAEVGTARVSVEGIDPEAYWAERGRRAPTYVAASNQTPLPMRTVQPVQAAQPVKPISLPEPASNAPRPTIVETYVPPVNQHATDTVLADTKKKEPSAASGLYLQVGAFANPDAAQLLRDKLASLDRAAPVFISSVQVNQQVWHRVRVGPIPTQDDAARLQDHIRVSQLGIPTLVRP